MNLYDLINDPQEPHVLLSQYFGRPMYWPLFINQAFSAQRGWFSVRQELGINNLRQLADQGVTAVNIAAGPARAADFTIAELGMTWGLPGSYRALEIREETCQT